MVSQALSRRVVATSVFRADWYQDRVVTSIHGKAWIESRAPKVRIWARHSLLLNTMLVSAVITKRRLLDIVWALYRIFILRMEHTLS